jgi:N-acetylglucosamine kinase-like BadF-type ATPase
MQLAIAKVWPDAEVHVESDLTAAALGLCDTSGGLVMILGTGMNAGHFDGSHLSCPMPSLGYLLGDEGSGADIGRTLLQDVFYDRMPSADRELLFGPDAPVLTDVLERVHRASHPARELAAYTALLAPHMDRPYVRELISGRFHALTEVIGHFFPLEQRRRVFATGSVAYGFRDLLADCLLDAGMSLTVVEADPLPGLVRYHQRQGS